MARSRNIKPGFFTNDVLGELPALYRLLFAGMWTLCDRAGRLEDRPKKIRAEVLPYDVCDPEEMLQSLEKAGFIQRYEVEGVHVIQVLAWHKHQNPHVKEAASTLPPSEGFTAKLAPAPYKNGASTVNELCEGEPLPERAGLIPSLLIPDSLIKSPRKPRAVYLEITLTKYLALCKTEGKKPIPADHAIRAYCIDAGITDDMRQIAWLVFKDRHLTNPKAKKYLDWPAAFANSIKDRWYHLWNENGNAEGHVDWSPTGLQAKRVIETRMNETKEPDHAPA